METECTFIQTAIVILENGDIMKNMEKGLYITMTVQYLQVFLSFINNKGCIKITKNRVSVISIKQDKKRYFSKILMMIKKLKSKKKKIFHQNLKE